MFETKLACVIPMTGQGVRFANAGYRKPKPLIEVNGVPMIKRLLNSFNPNWDYYFILAENHQDSGLIECLTEAMPQAKILIIPHEKKGPSWAVLSALERLPKDQPVLVSYCDYGMVWDHQQFESFVKNADCDACLVSYRGFHAHYLLPTNYAFSRLDGERVVEVREKGNFTNNREDEYASCGAYYFRTAALLKASIEAQIQRKMDLNGEYYTSLTIQAMLLENPAAHVRVFEIPGFFQWGTPLDLACFEYWEKTYRAWNKNIGSGSPIEVDQVLMPMAGFGSRFSKLTDMAKPLINLDGVPMYLRALQTLPVAKKKILVSRREIINELQKETIQTVALDEVPPGQALTTEKGVVLLDDQGDVLVSACDHGIVLDPLVWQAFRQNPDCVAAIFTIKGFPGVLRSPFSYSYVVVKAPSGEVTKVSVKKPVSEKAQDDHLLVGTFWFKNKGVLADGIERLKAKNELVNNELYLDAVFNEIIASGKKVRIVELNGYINWGDPDSLKESLYWQEQFMGRYLNKRNSYPGVLFAAKNNQERNYK